MKAYDIDILPRVADRARDDGWCFGLPPGISTAQWPLDPTNGHPLMHAFTLRLPEDYRVHGPDIVGLSFFAVALDHNSGGPTTNLTVADAIAADEPPGDPDLRRFWEAERRSHPRLHRMTDLLDNPYAAILLSEEELHGPVCMPPLWPANQFLREVREPRWLAMGGAAACWLAIYGPPGSGVPAEQHYLFNIFGEIPPVGLAYDRALQLQARRDDPNAGMIPSEDPVAGSGYVKPYYWEGGRIDSDSYREHAWTKGHKPNHIGGTMYPSQTVPPLSPYYIEFDETVGGCNFGGGNAQLDFRDMKFDWACG